MPLLARLKALATSWLRSRRLEKELDEELGFHRELEFERRLAAGASQEEARRLAALSLGGGDLAREACRDARPGALVRQLSHDIRYGVRLARKGPGFALAAILIVALGIGSVTAIFSVVYGVALRPLPYPAPERLVTLWSRMPRLGLARAFVNAADYQVWRRDNHVFEDIALVRPIANFNLSDGANEPERLLGARVSPNLLQVLGVVPSLGRGFREDEAMAGRDRVALLSDALWRRRFGASPDIVGRSIRLSGVPHLVVGVMPPEFHYPSREFEVWTPLTVSPAELSRADPGHNYGSVARLREGVALQAAEVEMSIVCDRLAREFPASNRDVGVDVVPMLDDTVQPVRSALLVLLGAVSCLLLIACLNLSNLLAARAATRQREFAMRLALGATRGRLILQSVAEVVPLLMLGGVAGVLGAWWAVRAFVPLAPPSLPRVETIEVNGLVLAVSTVLLVITGVFVAVVPAIHVGQTGATFAGPDGSRTTTGGRRQRLRSRLVVVAQIALVLPVLLAALLLVRTFAALARVDPGFRPDNVLTLHVAIPRSKYPDDLQVARFCRRLIDAVDAVAGVESAGMVNRLPLSGIGQMGALEVDGGAATSERQPSADWRTVTPGYFRAIGIPLLEGRLLSERDTDDRPPVGLVDDRLARAMWPGRSAVGKHFRIPVEGLPWVEVVGVVGHIRNDGLDVDTRPQVYWPYWQRAQDRMVLVVHGKDDVARLAPRIVQAVHVVDREQPAYDVRTMTEVMDRSLGQRWLNAALLGVFATMALSLASVGLYGVVAFSVTERRREFGIRQAVGASGADLMRQVLAQSMALSGLGMAIGVGAALPLSRALEGLVYGVSPRDPASVALCCGVLLIVALASSYAPARRAAATDPAVTLRAE